MALWKARGPLKVPKGSFEGFEGTLKGAPQRTFKFNFSPPLRYLPEGSLTNCVGAVVWKARELDFRSWYCGRQGGKFK